METIVSILMDAFFIALLIWCSYSDIKKRIVSNLSVVLLLCLGVARVVLLLFTGSTWWQYPTGLLLAIPFFIAWLKNVMGAGDVKLIMTIALYLGLLNTLVAFALMVPTLLILAIRSILKNKTVKCQMPFAPIITFGAIGAVLLGYLYALVQI